MADQGENEATQGNSSSSTHNNIPLLQGIENYSKWAARMRFYLGGIQATHLIKEDIDFFLTPETWPAETLVSLTIDLSVLDFDGGSELSMDLTTAFHQGDLLQTVDEEIRYPAGDINSGLSSVDWNWSQESEDAIAQTLDQQEIPEDWNFSFMTIQPNALQTFRSRNQANIPANPVVYDHLSTIWHIDSRATSHICAQRSMFQKYQKTEQSAADWTGAEPIKAIGVGSVRITLVRSSGETMVIILKGVLHVPGFLTNLVSVSRLREKEVYWRSDDFTLRMTKTDAKIEVCKIVGSLFVLQTEEAQDFAMITKVAKNVRQKPT